MDNKESYLIQNLQDTLKDVRKQRDQYGTAYKALKKEYDKLKEQNEILLAHNLIHMKQKVELQDQIYELEINDYLQKVDKQNLAKW